MLDEDLIFLGQSSLGIRNDLQKKILFKKKDLKKGFNTIFYYKITFKTIVSKSSKTDLRLKAIPTQHNF